MENKKLNETYEQIKARHQKEWNEQNILWAFSNEQFAEGMKENFNLTQNDTDKIISIGGGGYILKTDIDTLEALTKRQRAEMKEYRKSIQDIKKMFLSEMYNHEYGYTHDLTDTLESLGLTIEEIKQDNKLKKGLQLALKNF